MNTTIYTIKDVSLRTGISPHTIRFYDKEGLLTFIKRSPSGIRMFTEEDFEPLYTIQCLKRSGMSIKKIKEFMDLYVQGNDTIQQRLEMFQEQRENIINQINELNEMLDIVDYKCWYFEEAKKKGDIYFYRNLPEKDISPRITDFMNKVKNFYSKI